MGAIVTLPDMSEAQSTMEQNLAWIDLEMTGLDTTSDSILEIATIVTDSNLRELAVGPVLAIGTPLSVLEAMDDWNTRHHTESGLWQRCLEDGMSLAKAEQRTLDFLADWTLPGTSPLCGNSICQDRRFLHREMPRLEAWFHYRNLDVSTVKELAARWAPDILNAFSKASRHEALSDIRESIDELRHYRRYMGALAGEIVDN
jgi:oligoribonuclease